MRTFTLLAVLSLATAFVTILPAAEAATEACNVLTSDACGGWVCVEKRDDGAWTDDECTSKRDIETCQYQSDCCQSLDAFWCPETE